MPAKRSPKAPKNSSKEAGGQAPSTKHQAPATSRLTAEGSPYPVYDSIGAAASAEGFSVALLRKAKRAGAPGFKGSRVYFTPELRAWLSENMDRLKDTTANQIQEEKLRKLRWENDLKDRLFVRRAEVEAWIGAITEKIKSILRKKLRNELPPKLEGLRAPEISAKMESEVIGPICRLLRFEGTSAPAATPSAQDPDA